MEKLSTYKEKIPMIFHKNMCQIVSHNTMRRGFHARRQRRGWGPTAGTRAWGGVDYFKERKNGGFLGGRGGGNAPGEGSEIKKNGANGLFESGKVRKYLLLVWIKLAGITT